MKKRKGAVLALILLLLIVSGIFYFRYQIYYSHGKNGENMTFEVKKGEGNMQIASNLENKGLVSGKWYFYYYVRTHGLLNKIMPGQYQLSGKMSIPEIASTIANPEEKYVRITIPEGWDSKLISGRLKENNLDGDRFLEIVNNPGDFKERYGYLRNSKVVTLEGYLFPDTYFFKKDASAENIVGRMLDNFDEKLSPEIREQLKNENISINDAVIMASIIEEEVSGDEDRQIVSGIFWNRIAQGMPLQSDATITYVLGDRKSSHSYEETRLDSPFNTYMNKGLPPSPIDNPGAKAIRAAAFPEHTDYLYFLSDLSTGKTYYAKTFEDHVANKNKYGL